MGDPAPNDGEIPPVQAAQLPGADAENHAPAIVPQQAMASGFSCELPSSTAREI